MKTLLIICHAPSENTQKLLQAVMAGVYEPKLDLQIRQLSPEQVQPKDVLKADALLMGTLENLGYMSGLTKDFFDRCYYPLLDKKQGMAFALYIRAGHDGTATKRAFEGIITGLRWQWVQEPVILRGQWQEDFIEQVKELAMTLAVGLDAGIY